MLSETFANVATDAHVKGGVFGSLMGTPIINLPQTGKLLSTYHCNQVTNRIHSAVLGLHAIKEKPVAIDGKVEIRPVRLPSFSFKERSSSANLSPDDVSCAHI